MRASGQSARTQGAHFSQRTVTCELQDENIEVIFWLQAGIRSLGT